jgi:hypothetical protein
MADNIAFSHNNRHQWNGFRTKRLGPSSTVAYIKDCFPTNKEEEGEFLANIARTISYGEGLALYLGFSVCHVDDHFCRKTGRELSRSKMNYVMAENFSMSLVGEPQDWEVTFEVKYGKKVFLCSVKRSPLGTWFINSHWLSSI